MSDGGLLGIFGGEDPEDSKEKRDGSLSWLKKAVCPAVVISGMGLSGLLGSKVGLSWLDQESPALITLAAIACGIRGLVHVSQNKLSDYPVVMRNLTIANLPVTLLWAATAAVAINRPTNSLLPILLSVACAALGLLAALQGIVVIKLRDGKFKGAPAYPGIALGTAKVASLVIFRTGVTIGDVARVARKPGRRLFHVGKQQVFSALVAMMLIVGGLLIGNKLRPDLAPVTANPTATQQSAAPTPSLSTPAPTPHSSPTTSTPEPTPTPGTTGEAPYDEVCAGRGREPGTGAPWWAADKLNEAWFGPGANVAGCAQEVHVIKDKACPGAWEVGLDEDGDTLAVAIARACRPKGAIYLGNSAVLVQGLLSGGLPLSGSCRRPVDGGDVQLIYGPFGTIALVRLDSNDDWDTVVLPPAATAGWAELIARHGAMMWPRKMSSTTWKFLDADGGDLSASVHVTLTGGSPELAQSGVITDGGKRHPVRAGVQKLASVTPGAPEICH